MMRAMASVQAPEATPDSPTPPLAQAPAGSRAQRPLRLRRYPDRGLLGGVCAGIASFFRVEVLIVRLIMAMVIAVGGIGVAIYALAWALIPVAAESKGKERRPGAWREAVVIVLAVAGLLIGLRVLGLGFADAVICSGSAGSRSCGVPRSTPPRRARSPRRHARRASSFGACRESTRHGS